MLSVRSALKCYPKRRGGSCTLCEVCLKVTSVFFLGLQSQAQSSPEGCRLTSSSGMGTKAALPRASYHRTKTHAAFPGKGLCLLYKALLSNWVCVQKSRSDRESLEMVRVDLYLFIYL